MLDVPANEERYTDITTGNVCEGHYYTVEFCDYVLYFTVVRITNKADWFYYDLYVAFPKRIGNDNINASLPYAVTPMC